MIRPHPKSFEYLMNRALELNWCADWFCTTCGSMYFRPKLQKYSREEIIEGLKRLPQSYIDNPKSTEYLVFCFYSVTFRSGFDLIDPLKDSPVSEVLNRAITKSFRSKLINPDEPSLGQRKINKIMKLRERAKKHIWGAIRRKDFKRN
jgi:hypothetical protein